MEVWSITSFMILKIGLLKLWIRRLESWSKTRTRETNIYNARLLVSNVGRDVLVETGNHRANVIDIA